jgi:enoyl-CoA hydratase/carnithine racemase
MADYQDWKLVEDGHIASLMLDRPERRNSIGESTLSELRDITAYLQTRKDLWVVILQGQGRDFSSGMDLTVVAERLDEPAEDARHFLKDQQACLDAFAALEKPTIARLHGFCIGGGLLLALCCDYRIASKRTIFDIPEVERGIPVLWGTKRLSRMVGEGVAKEFVLLSRRFKADQALRYGLIHEVVAPEDLDRAVLSVAHKFLRLPPRTVGVAKRIINQSYEVSMRECQELELDAIAELWSSPDLREALQSLLEQRPPQYKGE